MVVLSEGERGSRDKTNLVPPFSCATCYPPKRQKEGGVQDGIYRSGVKSGIRGGVSCGQLNPDYSRLFRLHNPGRRIRRLRPKWTISTLLIVVAWSSVVIWLNCTPRVYIHTAVDPVNPGGLEYGYPWTYGVQDGWSSPWGLITVRPSHIFSYWRLAGNAVVGLLAVVVLTWGSGYLLRRITFGVKCDHDNGE